MQTFTIENETNNITLHTSDNESEAVINCSRFATEADLANLAANWPLARLVEIWNSMPGANPVKKFTDRQTAVSRIWKAVQHLGSITPASAPGAQEPVCGYNETADQVLPALDAETNGWAIEPQDAEVDTDVAPQSPDVGAEGATAGKKARRVGKATDGATAPGVREGSKTEVVLRLLRQPGGTTLKAIMDATGWQAHSVRGFISGTLNKKMALGVVSTKGESGERTYTVAA